MRTALLDYHLPPGRIADHPVRVRRRCRLMRLDRQTGNVSHHLFQDLPLLLKRNDLLVINDTAVIPARLIGQRVPGGGEAEVFLLERTGANRWRAMVRPGRRLRPGATVTFGEKSAYIARIDSAEENGTRVVVFEGRGNFQTWLQQFGAIPLPPYIDRPAMRSDERDYQTVYARHRGAVAAPTAGLHFDRVLAGDLRRHGITMAALTLHVGGGTFRPVRTEQVEDHILDAERYRLPALTQRRIAARRRSGRGRIIAVGTTVTRTLETVARDMAALMPETSTGRRKSFHTVQGRTDLLICPGHRFQLIDGLITNFHLPKSSLLALVTAFAGLEPVMHAYRIAIDSGYRFYSYGDAMLII